MTKNDWLAIGYEKNIIDNSCCGISFRDTFILVQSEKGKYFSDAEKLVSVQNTVNRDWSFYRRYFADTDFENMPLDSISKKDIEDITYFNLTRYSLRIKGLKALKGILHSVFAYAYTEWGLSDDAYRRVDFSKFYGLIAKNVPIEERAHSDFDLGRIMEFLHAKQHDKPFYIPAYALEMQILTGLRRGEIPPLLVSDIHADYVSISREQLTVKRNGDIKEHFVIVNHTKNGKNRHFPMTDDLLNFFSRYGKIRKKIYVGNDFLFPADTENGCISNNVVYRLYYRICKELSIDICKDCIRGTHSFRRNAITDFVNASNGNIILASQIFGNSPEVALQNYFVGADVSMAIDVLNSRRFYFN